MTQRNKRFKQSIVKSNILKDCNLYITNLSNKFLSPDQKEVLSLGLTFIPTRPMDSSTLDPALARFKRLNRLRDHFRDQSDEVELHPFKPKSTWSPPRADEQIEGYLQRVQSGIQKLTPLPFAPNMSRRHRKAVKELMNDTSLVIKNADKGSGIVVEDRHTYIRDGLAHLSDKATYRELNTDPTASLGLAINQFVQTLYNRGIIDKITKDYLSFPPDKPPRTQQIYFLKKIHKSPTAVRPIVSGCQGATERISQLIDLHLQPYVPKIDSYVKDSGHLIRLLEGRPFPKDCTLATIDVKAMYTNIPHEEGIKAILNRLYYNNMESDMPKIPPSSIYGRIGERPI